MGNATDNLSFTETTGYHLIKLFLDNQLYFQCGPGRIRTAVDSRRQIYSLMHLTTLPPTLKF